MKKQLILSLSIFWIALGPLLLGSCSKDKDDNANDSPFQLEENLIMGNKLFNSSLDDRNSKNSFEILKIERKNEILQVSIKGSDSVGSFKFIWDGRIQESYPMGIQLIMLYQGKDEDFIPTEEKVIQVNLQKIIGKRTNVNEYHFNIINGSKKKTATLNPDGTITNNNR